MANWALGAPQQTMILTSFKVLNHSTAPKSGAAGKLPKSADQHVVQVFKLLAEFGVI